MREWIKKQFSPPVFADDDKRTRLAQKLYIVLLVILAGAGVTVIVLPLVVPERAYRLLLVVPLFPVLLLLFNLNRRGHGKLTALLLIGALWLMITAGAATAGGIRSSASSVYVIIVLFTALLFGMRAAMGAAALCALTGLGMVYAEEEGFILSSALPSALLGFWFAQFMTFFAAVGLVYLAVRDVRETLARARLELDERQRAEVQLREAEAKYRTLVENLPGITYVGALDEAKTRLYISPQIEALLGHPAEEALANPNLWRQLLHPDDRERVLIEAERFYASEEPFVFEYRNLALDGRVVWFHDEARIVRDEAGRPQFILGFKIDITDRKQAEEKLHASDLRFRAMIENISDAIVLVSAEGALLYLSPSAERILGYTIAERMGMSAFHNIIEPQDVSRLEKIFGNLRAKPQATTSFEVQARHKDGSARWLEVTATNLLELGSVQAIIVNYRDITERIHAGKERETYIEEINNRNAELTQFTYIVSHDLRSPLVTIQGFLGMLEKDIRENRQDRVQNDFQRITGAVERMQALLSELLELSRVGRIINPPEEVDLVELTRQAVESLDARIRSRHVSVIVSPALPVVCGDRVRLREVMENLIDNAAKYSNDQPSPIIEIGARAQAGEQVLFVRDNGMGIERQYHTKIFGLFEKLDPNVEGTGIGLALVKRIVEVHGGRIWVESDGLGKGSTFCFTIPDKAK